MTPKPRFYDIDLSIKPTLPRLEPPRINPTQQNTDPSAYYTQALGFLPIDTRYMVNPTNSLAYNSMADVILNSAAHRERWANSSTPWMDDWWATPIRLIADTGILIKDTVFDPIAQGVIEDGWNGFLRGSSTALMNSLVNLGNTLDIVSNPIKGLVLDGGDGFIKGLVGDHNGRKQYDYMDYMNTGNGSTNLISSLALEIISDPLNWISWGGKAAVSVGAKTVANTVSDTVTNTLKTAVKKFGATSLDDIADELASTSKFLTKDSAKATLIAIADESGKLTDEAIDSFADSLKPLLKKTISRAELSGKGNKAYSNLSRDLMQSEKTRYKASLFSNIEMPPAVQKAAAQYLSSVAKNADDVLLPSTNAAIRRGALAYLNANKFESALRWTAGTTGLGEIVLLSKAGAKGTGLIRNIRALKDPGVVKTISDLEKTLDRKTLNNAVKALEKNAPIDTAFINAVYEVKNAYNLFLNHQTLNKNAVKKVTYAQKSFIAQIDALVKELNIDGVASFTDYIKYLDDANVIVKNTDVVKFTDELKNINKLLTEDFSDDMVRLHYKKSIDAHHYKNNKEFLTQAKSIEKSEKLLREFNRKYGHLKKSLEEYGDDSSAAIARLTTPIKQSKLDALGVLDEEIIPGVYTILRTAEKPDVYAISSFDALVKEFRDSLEEFKLNDSDISVRDSLIQSYEDLVEELNQFRKFNITEDINTSNASEIKNMFNDSMLTRTTQTSYSPTEIQSLKALADKEKMILRKLNKIPEYKNKYSKEAVARYVNSDEFKALSKEDQQVALKLLTENRRTFILKQKHGQDWLNTLNKAEALKNDIAVAKHRRYTQNTVDAVESNVRATTQIISQAIEELPVLSVKPLSDFIDPADISKYKLVVYSVINRTAAFINSMLGITVEGAALIRTLNHVKVTPAILQTAYENTSVGAFMQYLLDNGLLLKEYNVFPKTGEDVVENITDAFIEHMRFYAQDLLKKDPLRYIDDVRIDETSYAAYVNFIKQSDNKALKKALSDFESLEGSTRVEAKFIVQNFVNAVKEYSATTRELYDLLKNIEADELTLDKYNIIKAYALAEEGSVFYKTFEELDDADFNLKMAYEEGVSSATEQSLLQDINTALTKLKEIVYYRINKLHGISNGTEQLGLNNLDLAFEHAENFLKLSDDEIKVLANFNTEKIYDYPDAYLADLLTMYENADSLLYKVLNDSAYAADEVFGAVVTASKQLIERLHAYKSLVTNIANLAQANGLESFYTAGLVDALMTQLSKHREITINNISNVVDEMMTNTNLYIRNLFDAPSTSMTSVLGQIVTTLSKRTDLPPEAKACVERIHNRLKSGKAHSAVVDVDNLVDLLSLTKYTDDKRLNNLTERLLQRAKGKRIVAFDIESTDANAVAAHVFQISGKVLDDNLVELPGSKFNCIIRPPAGYKPTPNVLKELTQEADAEKWWNDSVVNAKHSETQLVFENIDDALNAFKAHCDAQGSVVLVGHNIKGYDIPTLTKRSNEKIKSFFNDVDKFDTMKHMNNNVMFQLVEEQEKAFKSQLQQLFEKALIEDNPALKNKPFQYSDVRTLSELKAMLQDLTTSNKGSTKILQGFGIEGAGEAGALEQIIKGILQEWSNPSKTLGKNKFFIVSKLNPDSLEDQIQRYIKELAADGLVDVALGKNIMQHFAANVFKDGVMINPVRVISYEVEDIFDLQKALKVYKVQSLRELPNGVSLPKKMLRSTDLARLTKHAKYIQRIRTWIPSDYIDEVIDDARSFLKEAAEHHSFIKTLYDSPDNITTVATAIYAYRLLSDDVGLKQNDMYKHFGRVDKKIADIRGIKDYEAAPILYNLDPDGGLPEFIFADDLFTYDKFVDTLRKNTVFDDIREYNVGHNLYNLHAALSHALLEPIHALAKELDTYLDTFGGGRKVVEHSIRRYNDSLDAAAIKEILERPNRVTALKEEAFARGPFVCFTTDSKIDLSDFKKDVDSFVVVDNLKNTTSTGDVTGYVHIIAVKRDVFAAATDMDIAPVVIKNVPGIDDTLYSFFKRAREYATEKGVKNMGHSRGDIMTTDVVEEIHDALRRAGVPEEDMASLPDVDVLSTVITDESGNVVRPAYFGGQVRANNCVIGNNTLWQFITDNSEVYHTTDPFKQIAYTISTAVSKNEKDLIYYCSLILNKHSDISTAEVFKSLTNEDLYNLLKENNDFCMVYITKAGYWDKTKSGLVVKELDLVNVKSIERAKKMGGVHIIPRTHAAELMEAVNEFKLPFIARIAKAISDVYKVAYLGSLGFIIRNLIDSNYKTYASLDGQVSLGKSVSHFIQTVGIVRKHTSVGQEYAAAMGRYFASDLEYEVFYKFCNNFNDDVALEDIVASYPEKLQRRVIKQLEKLSENVTATLVNKVKPNLLQPEMFSIVDAFINYGPSGGLAKTILANIPGVSKKFDDAGMLGRFNHWITRETPMRFVYGANDYIEQAARLSMFLQRLELGDTIDEANRAIIKTHFDYSDKTIGMLYTEIVFPFMSFSYKNLNFWIEMMYKNPMLVGQMENIFRTILDYQGLFEPNQEAYQSYDYTFDWSRDLTSFEANAPWTIINAARLYHILNGNITIKSSKNIKHDFGYGKGPQDTELYHVFKLSPSVLDATKMLFTPLNSYSERLLPPYETLLNLFINGLVKGEDIVEQMSTSSLANSLPYFDTIMQRVGYGGDGWRHNNIGVRIQDASIHQALPSVFGAAYVPVKDNYYWYDSDYNILGGFKTNYYAKKNYSNPYNSKYPSYTLTRMAQNKKPRSLYGGSKTYRLRTNQYNSYVRQTSTNILRHRLKDNYYYY